jgi:hypothetical protein
MTRCAVLTCDLPHYADGLCRVHHKPSDCGFAPPLNPPIEFMTPPAESDDE